MGSKTGLDGCGNSRPDRVSIPGPRSLYRIVTPTELSRPYKLVCSKYNMIFFSVILCAILKSLIKFNKYSMHDTHILRLSCFCCNNVLDLEVLHILW